MRLARTLLLDPAKGYPYGVIAGPSLYELDELHGPFDTKEEAEIYETELRSEYSDYRHSTIVRIEVPAA